uniref:NADH-ubiquinone oxidoreductase chain 6 n=1 Tax=Metrocoris triangulatus TaxID=3087094 RepID=A0AB38Z6G6_9HEMI|nr:NADH dehydrogenase subunit 6 [Metrocoris triangulatus]WPW46993.1 NADH dehydrogenase subunit 6 [Metrocoris triangulatus]
MKLMYMFVTMMSTIMIMARHPLSMGFNLILMTAMLSMMMNLFMKYSWYSYILILVMLGGMLVLFMYMASVASNEIMKFSLKMMLTTIMVTIIVTIFMKNEMIMNMQTIIPTIENQQSMSMMKLFNSKTMIITILLAMYLLMTMIYVIFINNVFEGPMRKKN